MSEAIWTEARLLRYIDDKIEESLTLDYKHPDALASERSDKITKEISAFANSAGGIVIYGLCEFKDPALKHRAEKILPIDRKNFSRDWLEQMIGRIQPRISGIIHPVQLSSAPEHVAYVVEIPQSSVAHQATDYIYYKRYNFESVPMEDFEMRDINRRKIHPLVTTELRMSVGKFGHENRLIWHVKNESNVMARWVATVIDVPTKILEKNVLFAAGNLRMDDDGFTAYRLQPSNRGGNPLFPGAELMLNFEFSFLAQMIIQPGAPPILNRDVVKFKTFADEMPPSEGAFELNKIIVRSEYSY